MRRRVPVLLSVGLLSASALAAGSAPVAATADAPRAATGVVALEASGPFLATADASLLRVDVPALSPAVLPQTNIDLAHSSAVADSDADLDAEQDGAQRTFASAATTGDSALLDAPLDLSTNTASAPEDEANEDVLIEIPDNPLLVAEAIRTSALANWASDTECVASDTPLSLADQTLADATVLQPEEGQSVVEIIPGDDGAADTEAATFLSATGGPDDARAVQAVATTRIAGANLFNGFTAPGESVIEVGVVNAPSYVATATGLPGGASVEGDDPVVDVSIGGEEPIRIEAGELEEEPAIGFTLADLFEGLDPLLGELQPIIRLSIPVETNVAADGTSASVTASLLRVEILPPDATGQAEPLATALAELLAALGLDVGEPLAVIDLAPIAAVAVAPAGGITCGEDDNPLRELNKTVSAQEVAPGGTFDYTITVPNRGECTLTDVVVVDEITGPSFEVIGTEPAATVEGGTVTFDVGEIPPNATVVLRITVRVGDDAPDGATFDDTVTATGICDGREVGEDDELLDVPTVRRDFEGPCSVRFSNKESSHDQVMPSQTFTYFINVFNSGAEACTDVEVTDTLDDRLAFVSCNQGCTNQGQNVTWTLAQVPGGSSTTLSVVVQVDADASGTLENAAVIDPANGDPVTVRFTGPVIGEDSIPREPIPPRRGPTGPLPKTGGTLPATLAGLALAGALALAAARRRGTAPS